MAGHLPFGVPSMQPSTGQGSQATTFQQSPPCCLTAAPRTPPSVKSKPEATAKAEYRLRSTNPIPAHQAKSALDYKSALVFRKNHHQPEALRQQENSEQFIILARLKAEELLRRAENEKIRENQKSQKNSSRSSCRTPINRTSLRSLRAVTLFASKKSVPRQPSAPCKQVLIGKPMLT